MLKHVLRFKDLRTFFFFFTVKEKKKKNLFFFMRKPTGPCSPHFNFFIHLNPFQQEARD